MTQQLFAGVFLFFEKQYEDCEQEFRVWAEVKRRTEKWKWNFFPPHNSNSIFMPILYNLVRLLAFVLMSRWCFICYFVISVVKFGSLWSCMLLRTLFARISREWRQNHWTLDIHDASLSVFYLNDSWFIFYYFHPVFKIPFYQFHLYNISGNSVVFYWKSGSLIGSIWQSDRTRSYAGCSFTGKIIKSTTIFYDNNN